MNTTDRPGIDVPDFSTPRHAPERTRPRMPSLDEREAERRLGGAFGQLVTAFLVAFGAFVAGLHFAPQVWGLLTGGGR
jgi:hypothetical protein